MNISRRTFIASVALGPVACGIPLSYERGTPVAQPNPLPSIRPPKFGQEWSYIKRDVFNGKVLGLITERVASIGSSIVINRSDESGGILPNEVQSSWGMVVTDPQWTRIINFNPPIPLWPQELTSNWSKQVNAKYSLAGYPGNAYSWQEQMNAQGWEQITVPAGNFLTLRYQNLINYESEDDNKTDCVHRETIWFSPDIGRWVAREVSGSYRIQGQVDVSLSEDSFQWQLSSYK